MPDKQLIFHDIPPVFAPNSRVLLLGSLPSPKSRAQGFYYGHPQNRFWPPFCRNLHQTGKISPPKKPCCSNTE